MMKKFYAQRDQGVALLLLIVLFSAITITFLFGVGAPIVRQLKTSKDFDSSQKSYYVAEAGGEDAFYRVKNAATISFPYNLSLNNGTTTISLNPISGSEEEIMSQGVVDKNYRTVLKSITVSNGFSFRFGIQTGIGGLYLYNNAVVNGNVYSSGQVIGNNVSANSYNFIDGAVVSASSSGLVKQVRASSSVYSKNINSTTVGGDAYYQTISNSTVAGASHPGSSDQPTIEFPITDAQIAQWESDAAAGGVLACGGATYTINSSIALGPKKIPCNVSIGGNGTVVTLNGAVWITGNLTIAGSGGAGVQIRIADAVGDKSIVMIADNPSNKTGSGQISISGNSNFYGSTGNDDSYVMLISGNTSAETGGSNLGIDVVNGATGNVLVFAPHGEIRLQNNVNLREVTAYKLSVYNNAVVNYLIGLSQPLFTSGPGGTWKIRHWKEI